MSTMTSTDHQVETRNPPQRRPRRRRFRRALAWVAGAALVTAGAGGAVVVARERDAAPTTEATVVRTTATVQSRDLVSTTTLDGTLTYAGGDDIAAAGAGGTITWLPDVGTVVQPGEVLYEVDGRPVILLPGTLPQWRALSTEAEDGADVAALEQALIDLGHATTDDLVVDETYTSTTASVVEEFREAVGLPDGDAIGLGEIIYADGPQRITGTALDVGDRVNSGGAVLNVSSPDRIVSVELAAADQGLVAIDDVVTVELPDGTEIDGTVTFIAAVARAVTQQGSNGATTYVIDVEVVLAEGGDAFDEAPVEVTVTEDEAIGVLAVPVEALLALAEGGYALEVVHADGTTSLIAVEIGDFEDGWVEVVGAEVTEGLTVVSA